MKQLALFEWWHFAEWQHPDRVPRPTEDAAFRRLAVYAYARRRPITLSRWQAQLLQDEIETMRRNPRWTKDQVHADMMRRRRMSYSEIKGHLERASAVMTQLALWE